MSDITITVSDIALDTRTIIPATVANSYTGLTIQLTCAEAQTYGDACHINSSGYAEIANSDVIANANAVLLSVGETTGVTTNNYLINGTIKLNSTGWTKGGLLYLSTGGYGNTLTQTPPSTTNTVTQILGVALSTDTILFTQNLTQVEHA